MAAWSLMLSRGGFYSSELMQEGAMLPRDCRSSSEAAQMSGVGGTRQLFPCLDDMAFVLEKGVGDKK